MRSLLYDNISKRLRIAADPSLKQRYLHRLGLKKRNERGGLSEDLTLLPFKASTLPASTRGPRQRNQHEDGRTDLYSSASNAALVADEKGRKILRRHPLLRVTGAVKLQRL